MTPLLPRIATASALLAAAAVAAPAQARQWTATCSDLAGMRIEDRGGENAFKGDAIRGATWIYQWDSATRKGTLTLPASHASDGKAHKQEGTVTSHRGGFFTLVSSLSGAVWTHALYPESGRVLATQSTTAGGTALSGRMLVGNCQISSR